MVMTELVKAGLFFVVFESVCLNDTCNSRYDTANCGDNKEYHKSGELLIIHNLCFYLVNRNDGVVCLHGDFEDADNLHRADGKKEDGVALAVVLHALGAEEGEEEEEKVINDRHTDVKTRQR